MVKPDGTLNGRGLYRTVATGIRMLDDVIDTFKIPVERVQQTALQTRRAGLGVMGWADYLIMRGIGYDTEEALREIAHVMQIFKGAAIDTTRKLAEEKGVFPVWAESIYAQHGDKRRNAYLSSCAPTGTTAMIVTPEISSGIEPVFAWAFVKKNILGGVVLDYDCHYLLRQALESRGLLTDEILSQIKRDGSIAHIDAIPADLKTVFRSAHDISPEWHVRVQAAFQADIDNAISKVRAIAQF